MQQNQINFSYNWNKKLDCNAFTTLRISNQGKYQLGNEYNICLKGKLLSVAKITAIKTMFPESFTEYVARLDTGYSVLECIEIIRKMYPKIDVMKTKFDFILLVKVKAQAGTSTQFNPLDHEAMK